MLIIHVSISCMKDEQSLCESVCVFFDMCVPDSTAMTINEVAGGKRVVRLPNKHKRSDPHSRLPVPARGTRVTAKSPADLHPTLASRHKVDLALPRQRPWMTERRDQLDHFEDDKTAGLNAPSDASNQPTPLTADGLLMEIVRRRKWSRLKREIMGFLTRAQNVGEGTAAAFPLEILTK